MHKESDKPPDVYPIRTETLFDEVRYILDRDAKREKHAQIANGWRHNSILCVIAAVALWKPRHKRDEAMVR